MKALIGLLLMTSSVSFASSYLPENDVRDICLRKFARTITCTANVDGKTLSVDLDKERIQAEVTNYFEYGKAITGFSKKAGFFSRNPRWLISCDPRTGKLTGTSYIIRNRIDTDHSVKSVCR